MALFHNVERELESYLEDLVDEKIGDKITDFENDLNTDIERIKQRLDDTERGDDIEELTRKLDRLESRIEDLEPAEDYDLPAMVRDLDDARTRLARLELSFQNQGRRIDAVISSLRGLSEALTYNLQMVTPEPEPIHPQIIHFG